MPSFTRLVPFDRPLASAVIAPPRRGYTEAEIGDIREAAYCEGSNTARAYADQQMVELRHGLQELQDGLFAKLPGIEPAIIAQLQNALPALALDLARRLVAGYEPTAEVVQRHCAETLESLYPERENLELLVCEHDSELLDQLAPGWSARYPGLRITVDATLKPGDCQVRSRFGITDARISAKLETIERELLS